MTYSTQHWKTQLAGAERPAYLVVPDLIAADLAEGRLAPGDRLPVLRELAEQLGLHYSTVARAYVEARKRGLVDSTPGAGTFARGGTPSLSSRGNASAEMSMNLPPEPQAAELLGRMRESSSRIFTRRDLFGLLRYQEFGGLLEDRDAGARWLRRQLPGVRAEDVLVCPGIHSVLVSLVSQLVPPGQTMCVESITYPGMKAIATQLGVHLHPLPMDEDGLSAAAFEEACKAVHPKVLYCCPTVQNPSTRTFSQQRREQIADIALRYNVLLIEDDPYAMLPSSIPEPLALLAPELTYYVTGFSKCLGAGMRTAYVKVPTAAQGRRLAATMRAFTVMASPVTNAIATQWINDGTAAEMLAAVRAESVERQKMAARVLAGLRFEADPEGFHLWLHLPPQLEPVPFAALLREHGIWGVASAAFATDGDPEAAVRLCLGGAMLRLQCEDGLRWLAQAVATAQGGPSARA
jgi:DNA-binding transcriptional MocR family regulator